MSKKAFLCLSKKSGFGLGHTVEVEIVERLLHEGLNLVVAEIFRWSPRECDECRERP